jgi:diguanylate cyclase (GGDEF)-like protein
MRDGEQPRPAGYDAVHWDLVLGGHAPAEALPAPAQALVDRIRAAGFSEAELALLDEARRRAAELLRVEAHAVELVSSGLDSQRAPALDMLHNPAYLQMRAAALEPVRQFMREAGQRLAFERERAADAAHDAGWLAAAALLLLALHALISTFNLDRSVRVPMAVLRDWAQTVRAGRMDRRTRLAGRSEFGELSSVIDQMADSVERNLGELREEVLRRTRAEEVVRHLANHDALTGLPALRLLHDRLERAMARAQREGQGVAVLFVDLNGFKPINDRWGHESGDAVLKAVAQRLQGGVRDADTVGRIGGDEFLVILPDVATLEIATQVRDKLDAALREPVYLPGPQILVNLSAAIGIALFPSMAGDMTTLLRLADEDMYRVKAMQKASGSAPQR